MEKNTSKSKKNTKNKRSGVVKTKMSKKAKNNRPPMKKSTKIAIFAVILGILAVSATVFTILYTQKKKNDRTVNVAFYNLSTEVADYIKSDFPKNDQLIYEFTDISGQIKNSEDLTKFLKKNEKFDLFFTWKGLVSNELSKNSQKISNPVWENIPRSLREKERKQFPIVLDHYEVDFYTPLMKDKKLEIPATWKEFEEYLETIKDYVFCPFFCDGKTDRTLFALIGSIIEAKYGAARYEKFLADLNEWIESATIAEKLASGQVEPENEAETASKKTSGTIEKLLEKNPDFKETLDMLKTWPQKGYVHPQWFRATKNDVSFFMEQKQTGVIFTRLSEHREFPYKLIKDYEESIMPSSWELATNDAAKLGGGAGGAKANQTLEHGIISPALVCLQLTNNMNADDIVKAFGSYDIQSAMTNQTKLAPVHYTAETYDKQADDVRFWAASCAKGALPDPALACFQLDEDKMADLAKEIRKYLE